MTLTPLDYISADTSRQQRRWSWRGIIITLALSAALIASLTISVRKDEHRMDPVTGSAYSATWIFGMRCGSHVDVSPLETRLKNSGIHSTPAWRFLDAQEHNIYGVINVRACGLAPPIYQIHPFLKEFADASTDAELREFVRIMQSGTDAQQEAAVKAAFEKVLQELRGPSSGG